MSLIRLGWLAVVGLVVVGCTPKYPKCDNDEHCKKGEHCVNGQCQQCRSDKDCGEGQVCRGGRCEARSGYCTSQADCPDGQACVKNRCVPCKSDGDCGEGGRCRGGRCLKPGSCTTDEDCPENHECQNGVCVGPPGDSNAGAPCELQTVYFDFDEFVLSSEALGKLQAAVTCLKSARGRSVRIEGHCDPRGTEEYNLALGDRRAHAVKRYLARSGVSGDNLRVVSKGKLEATGTNESGWALDRKVTFFWE
jgi:peptidoglycan-associated lipoprotein